MADSDLSSLEEERDLLLRSLDDLDVEFEAGDLDRADYETLRDGYIARAASVLRRLETAPDGEDRSEAAAGEEPPINRPSSLEGRRVLIGLMLLGLVAVLAGVILARTVGERGVNDQITGGIDESARNKVPRCQELGSTGGDLVGALECFDEILADDPANPEALAYRGWYLLLAAGSLQAGDESSGADQADAVELMANGLDYLDRAIEADPSFPDPLAFRATAFDRLGEGERACIDIATLKSLDPPQFFLDQTAGIAARNNC